ncbi:MAG TPA: hypothetical protein VJ770_17015 [Stellaceae bacterium]|nr:hypothetical protein [Stellaceae bacterium]
MRRPSFATFKCAIRSPEKPLPGGAIFIVFRPERAEFHCSACQITLFFCPPITVVGRLNRGFLRLSGAEAGGGARNYAVFDGGVGPAKRLGKL